MNQKRQELQSNLLADRLEEGVIALKPYLKWILAVFLALIAIGIAYGVRQQTEDQATADSWTDLYFAAGRPDQLDAVYQNYPGKQAGALWARQTEADSLMGRALSSVYLDRDLSDELFSQAAKGYQDVLNSSSESLLMSRATLGLAQALDGQGKSAEALNQYKRLLGQKGIHASLAEDVQRRIGFIESDEGKSFFEWYQQNRPTAPKPVDVPGNLNSLPGMPNLQFNVPKTTTPAPAANDMPASDSPQAPASTDQPANTNTPSSFEVPPASPTDVPEATVPAPTSSTPSLSPSATATEAPTIPSSPSAEPDVLIPGAGSGKGS